MKKIIVALLFGLFITTGCEAKNPISKSEFVDTMWVRNTSRDEEIIHFGSDGTFGYSCACGNPVNDADLCETYTYVESKNEIKLNCIEQTKDTISKIEVISVDENTLKLKIKSEIRIFEKDVNID